MASLRIILIAIAFIISLPAMAQEWTVYHNERFGATAEIPPAFAPSGPEAANSDGLIFRTRTGALLTIYGAATNGSFEDFVAKAIGHDQSYNAWPIGGQTITPSWAEYWGSRGGQILRVRIESSCNGRIAVVAKYQGSGVTTSTVDRALNSLEAGSASSC